MSNHNVMCNPAKHNFKPLVTIKLPSREEVDNFNKTNNKKTGKTLTLEYMHTHVYILQHGFSKKNCFRKLSRITLDTIQGDQRLKDFIESV